MRFLFLWTTITSVVLLIQRVWAPDKLIEPKSSFDTIFRSIIARPTQIQLQILCWSYRKKTKIKKMSSKLRMTKSFIICKIHWPIPTKQNSVFYPHFYLSSYCTCINFSFRGPRSYVRSNNFGMVNEKSSPRKGPILLTAWAWSFRSCRTKTNKLASLGQNR